MLTDVERVKNKLYDDTASISMRKMSIFRYLLFSLTTGKEEETVN